MERITSTAVGLLNQSKETTYLLLLEIRNKITNFAPELFDGIAPQIAEIRTVAKSLPKSSKNPANILLT